MQQALSHGVRGPKYEAMINGRLAVVLMIAVAMALSSCAGAATAPQVAAAIFSNL